MDGANDWAAGEHGSKRAQAATAHAGQNTAPPTQMASDGLTVKKPGTYKASGKEAGLTVKPTPAGSAPSGLKVKKG